MPRKIAGGERLEMIQQAKRLYHEFTGHRQEFEVARLRVPDMPKALTVIGECDGIMYQTVRDGEREKYIHRFKAAARPLLCVAPDGSRLFLIGGEYDFTERGIVDR